MQLCVAVFGNKSLVIFSCFSYFGTSAIMHVSVYFTLPVSTNCAHVQTLTHFFYFFFHVSFLSLSLCLFWGVQGRRSMSFTALFSYLPCSELKIFIVSCRVWMYYFI